MRMNSTALTRAAFLFVASFFPVLANAQAYSGPNCLGPFCVDRKLSLEALAQELGGPPSRGSIYGYRTQDGRAFLIVAEGYICLRDFAKWGTWREKDERLTTQNLYGWKTPEGIGLGSSEEDVVKAYGKPSGEENLESQDSDALLGEKEMIYKGRLSEIVRAARFRIRHAKVSWIELENDAFQGPDCLGASCAAGFSSRGLFKQLGPPARPTSGNKPAYCYKSQGGTAFLRIELGHEAPAESDGLFLSDFPNCMHSPVKTATSDLQTWKTPEGIGLGSTEEDVLKAYGKPSREAKTTAHESLAGRLDMGYRGADPKPQIADKGFVYGPRELEVVEFGIRNGKVSYILLSDSE